MTYIDYLNRFNQFLESSALPPSAQLLYYKLLHIFNRAGWPPTVQVDNQRLMTMAGLRSTKAAISARNRLVNAGLIQYEQGKKGMPNRYVLCEKQLFCLSDGTKNATKYATKYATENDTINATTNATHIKNKTKNKTKTSPPKPPKGASVGSPSYDIDELAALAVLDLPEEL